MGLGLVEVILAIEDEFGITVPDSDTAWSQTVTVGDLAELVSKYIGEQHGESTAANAVTDRVIAIVEEHSGLWFKKKVTAASRLQDLLS